MTVFEIIKMVLIIIFILMSLANDYFLSGEIKHLKKQNSLLKKRISKLERGEKD